jgi:formate transporter
MLANWLVGLAAFFATMGRTLIDKFVPLFLAVSLFVAADFNIVQQIWRTFRWPLAWESDPVVRCLELEHTACCPGESLGGLLLVTMPLWISFGATHSAMTKGDDPGH